MSDFKRKVTLVGFSDGYTYDFNDDGTSRSGDDSASRQTLVHALSKSKMVNGKELKLFKLSKVPSVLDADFDRRYLQHDGEWMLPTPAWLDAQAKTIDAARGNAEAMNARAAAQIESVAQAAAVNNKKQSLGVK